jgi:rhamnosyltransferase
MHLAAVSILYNPSNPVIENLLSYCNEVDELYIMDNSATGNGFITEKFTGKNVFYFHDGENKGIAARLNQAAKKALENGFEWLLTMDQDSAFNNNLKQYKEYIAAYPHKEITAQFGVNFSKPITNAVYTEVPILITSGSIINLTLFNAIGGFDEQLFIDEVDSEYCYRSRIFGYKIVECSSILLQHHLGEIQMGRSLKSGKLTPRTLHAPIRMYYMVRNYFYVVHKLPTIALVEKKEMKRGLLLRIKNNIIYNQKRLDVIKSIIKGYFDFRNNKMGKAHL